MIDVPPAIAAAVRDCAQECILQGAAFERWTDIGMRDSPGEIPGKDEAISGAHQRQPISPGSANRLDSAQDNALQNMQDLAPQAVVVVVKKQPIVAYELRNNDSWHHARPGGSRFRREADLLNGPRVRLMAQARPGSRPARRPLGVAQE
jgi:hypothetical protein